MKKAFLTLFLLAVIAAPARADDEIPNFNDPLPDPVSTEGMSEPADGGSLLDGDVAGSPLDDGGDSTPSSSLEAAADQFANACYEKLGPYSNCFEDYETTACVTQRDSCLRAGAYSY